MSRYPTIMAICLAGLLHASEPDAGNPAPAVIEPVLLDRSLFADRVATATVRFDTVIDAPEQMPELSGECRILDIEVNETPDSKLGKSVAVIRFIPGKAGVFTLPALEFTGGGRNYQTSPMQLVADAPRRSAEMRLSMKPARHQVYEGEPVRVDLSWECDLPAPALKALDLQPAFFNDPGIEVVVPRAVLPEAEQVGLPIGGRRVVAKRTLSQDHPGNLGRIELPVYLRFSKTGKFTLPATRLECALLANGQGDFGRYAAYFNNALFEPVDAGERYSRVYTVCGAMDFEVIPLPAQGRRVDFSAWFAPLDLDVSVKPTEVEVGQLMEFEIRLSGETPDGMLEAPAFAGQPGLRERFLVDNDTGRLWQPDGAIFRTRIRALSTSVHALPALHFQVFDPAIRDYRILSTHPIPLRVKPSKGRDFIPLKSFKDAAVKLNPQPEGIWHHMEAHRMNDLLNHLFVFLNRYAAALLLAGPAVFLLLHPVVRERRRRAIDEGHRQRVDAYRAFSKLPPGSAGKWPAFLRFMAVSFGAGDDSWTVRDSERALESVGADDEDIGRVVAMHAAADAHDFGRSRRGADFAKLDAVARRVAGRIFRSGCAVLLAVLTLSGFGHAAERDEADRLFRQALKAQAGSDDSKALYMDSALKFEAAAESGDRPGDARVLSGNAWFQAGELGRAIAAYRQAGRYLPFDAKLAANLATARAMALNDVSVSRSWWNRIPNVWIKPLLVVCNFLFWGVCLIALRYRGRWVWCVVAASGFCLALVATIAVRHAMVSRPAGVLIVDAVYARKGPDFGYANAFKEPLHDGLEFSLLETEDGWGLIELTDSRRCWVRLCDVQLLPEI